MVETLEKDEHRIDRASQVMLRALNGNDEWSWADAAGGGGPLAEWAGVLSDGEAPVADGISPGIGAAGAQRARGAAAVPADA